MDKTDFLIYVNVYSLLRSVPVGDCLPVHPEGWLRGGCPDEMPVGYVLLFDTLNIPPPPPAVFIISLSRTMSRSITATQLTNLDHDYIIDKLQL